MSIRHQTDNFEKDTSGHIQCRYGTDGSGHHLAAVTLITRAPGLSPQQQSELWADRWTELRQLRDEIANHKQWSRESIRFTVWPYGNNLNLNNTMLAQQQVLADFANNLQLQRTPQAMLNQNITLEQQARARRPSAAIQEPHVLQQSSQAVSNIYGSHLAQTLHDVQRNFSSANTKHGAPNQYATHFVPNNQPTNAHNTAPTRAQQGAGNTPRVLDVRPHIPPP